MKEKNIHKKSWQKNAICLFVCLWVENFELFACENIWISLDESFFFFWWISVSDELIKEGNIHTKKIFSFLHSFSNQPTRTKTVDEKKNKIKSQSPHDRWLKISSRPLTKTKKITFFHIQFQFLSVIQNKLWTLSIWKAFHYSKRQLHFLNSNQLTSN